MTFRNPLVKMNIKWTDEMAADFRRYESEVKTVIPGCWLKSRNITSAAVRRRIQPNDVVHSPPVYFCSLHIS